MTRRRMRSSIADAGSSVDKFSYEKGSTAKLTRNGKSKEDIPFFGELEKQNVFTLTKYEDLPPWLQENHFILSGYRVNFSCALCVKSLFHRHNETWCVWTHLIGFVMFFVLSFITPLYLLSSPSFADVLVFLVFLICAQMQMGFSAVYHLFCCHSPPAYKWLATLDYSGISIMIVGCYYPPLYYGFECFPKLQGSYLLAISVLGCVGLVLGFLPVFSTPRFRVPRTLFYIIFGCFAIFPVPHLSILNQMKDFYPVILAEILMGSLYIIGAVFYSTRIPERWYPGKFDFGCSSHVIWHFFTIAAALTQLWTCLKCYEISKNRGSC